jgi:hypothetical protein
VPDSSVELAATFGTAPSSGPKTPRLAMDVLPWWTIAVGTMCPSFAESTTR